MGCHLLGSSQFTSTVGFQLEAVPTAIDFLKDSNPNTHNAHSGHLSHSFLKQDVLTASPIPNFTALSLLIPCAKQIHNAPTSSYLHFALFTFQNSRDDVTICCSAV
jgi:hypothetical protein